MQAINYLPIAHVLLSCLVFYGCAWIILMISFYTTTWGVILGSSDLLHGLSYTFCYQHVISPDHMISWRMTLISIQSAAASQSTWGRRPPFSGSDRSHSLLSSHTSAAILDLPVTFHYLPCPYVLSSTALISVFWSCVLFKLCIPLLNLYCLCPVNTVVW